MARSVLSVQRTDSLAPEEIDRFVHGTDVSRATMTDEEAAQELNDPFAVLLLVKGTFHTTLREVMSALDRATGEGAVSCE